MSKRMVSSGRRAGGGGGDGEEARGAADLEDLGLALEMAAATLDDDGFDFLPFAPSPTPGASFEETASSTTLSGTRRSTGRGVSTSSIGMGEWCAGDEEGGGDDEPSSDADSAEARSSGTSSGAISTSLGAFSMVEGVGRGGGREGEVT